jgi:hypothetical protein
VQDYLQFGPIADLQVPALHFLYLTFRYSIPLTEISILSWAWYAPVEPIAIAETESVAIEIAEPIAAAIPETPPVIETIAEPETINLDPLAFDPQTGILSFRGKTCEIPFKTYQHALCAKLFERPGVRVDEKDIMRAIDWEMDKADSDRLVKDAVYAVNRKAEIELGIEKILVWKKFTAWVNDEYLSDFLGG